MPALRKEVIFTDVLDKEQMIEEVNDQVALGLVTMEEAEVFLDLNSARKQEFVLSMLP